MASSPAYETRAVIKFCFELGYSQIKIYDMIKSTTSEKKISRTQVFEWHGRFREGRKSLEDAEGKGRTSSLDAVMVKSV